MTDHHHKNRKFQRQFLPLFGFLIFADLFATWAGIASGGELDALTGLWFGPMDDMLYGIAGLQALYAFLDPDGRTRGTEAALGTVDTVKKVGQCLISPDLKWPSLAARFYEGSQLGLVALPLALGATALGHSFLPGSHVLSALAIGAGCHLAYIVPIFLIAGLGFALFARRHPGQAWKIAMAIGLMAALGRLLVDGRIEHHLYHFFKSLNSLQAWGAAFCWIGVGNHLVERAVEEN